MYGALASLLEEPVNGAPCLEGDLLDSRWGGCKTRSIALFHGTTWGVGPVEEGEQVLHVHVGQAACKVVYERVFEVGATHVGPHHVLPHHAACPEAGDARGAPIQDGFCGARAPWRWVAIETEVLVVGCPLGRGIKACGQGGVVIKGVSLQEHDATYCF